MQQDLVYDTQTVQSPLLAELSKTFKAFDLIALLISTNIKTRYKRSVLGVAWTMLNPLLMMIVMTIVFSRVLSFRTSDYAVYLLSGLLVWNFFTESTTAAMNGIVNSGTIINRVKMPIAVYVVSAVGSGLVNLGLSMGPLLLIMLIVGVPIKLSALFLPVPVLLVSLFALGLGFALSSLAVFFADILPLYSVILRAWMYLTPIIYPIRIIPEEIRWILRLNPMFYFVDNFRTPLYGGDLPEASSVLISAGFGVLALIIGWWIFANRSDEYAYLL